MYKQFQGKMESEAFLGPSYVEWDPEHLHNVPVGISGLGYAQMEWAKFIFFLWTMAIHSVLDYLKTFLKSYRISFNEYAPVITASWHLYL